MPAVTGWQEVGSRIWVRRYDPFNVNVTVVAGSDGALLVDTRTTLVEALEVRHHLGELPVGPVTALAVTHHHLDHCLGAGAFPGVPVWATAGCRASLRSSGIEQREAWLGWLPEEQHAHVRASPLVIPDRVVEEEVNLDVGDRRVELRYLGRGHTDHDLVVHVPDAGVVLAGDLVEVGAPPAFEDAYPYEWPATLRALEGAGADTVVPGHGPPTDPAGVETQREELAHVAALCREVLGGVRSRASAVAASPYPELVTDAALARAPPPPTRRRRRLAHDQRPEGMVRVGVVGAAGRMGREVCRAVADADDLELAAAVSPSHAGHRLADVVPGVTADLELSRSLDAVTAAGCEVAVEFTGPASVGANLCWLLEHGVHAVVGATGIGEADLDRARALADAGAANALIAPNFAVGAVLLMRFAAAAARHLPHVEIIELHHDGKADAPSGTALRTAELVAEARSAAPEVTLGDEGHPGARGADHHGVRVHAVRLPGLVAHQEVVFGGTGQTLTVRHDSIDRTSFMPGVLLACRRVAALDGLVVGLDQLL